MGTSQQTTSSGTNQSNLQFNPISQGVYNSLVGGAGGVLGGYINNPFGNPFYSLGAGQSQKGAQQAGANNMAALQQNMLTSGLSGQGGAGFKQAQQAQTGRANQAMSSQANIQNVLSALQRQMSAAGTGLSFSPQLTGQTGNFSQNQQTQTGGLGTWLPQLAGAAIGGLTGGLGGLGGLAGMMGGGSGAGGIMSGGLPGGLSGGGWNSVLGINPGMAGMGSSGLSGMIPSSGGYNPLFGSMFNPQ